MQKRFFLKRVATLFVGVSSLLGPHLANGQSSAGSSFEGMDRIEEFSVGLAPNHARFHAGTAMTTLSRPFLSRTGDYAWLVGKDPAEIVFNSGANQVEFWVRQVTEVAADDDAGPMQATARAFDTSGVLVYEKQVGTSAFEKVDLQAGSLGSGRALYRVTLSLNNGSSQRSAALDDFSFVAAGLDIDPKIANPKSPFAALADMGDGWRESDWFGALNDNPYPWIFHEQHGWMFVQHRSEQDDVFLYDQSSQTWWYTSQSIFPSIFNFHRNSWMFYVTDSTTPRRFVDLVTAEFFSLE